MIIIFIYNISNKIHYNRATFVSLTEFYNTILEEYHYILKPKMHSLFNRGLISIHLPSDERNKETNAEFKNAFIPTKRMSPLSFSKIKLNTKIQILKPCNTVLSFILNH